MNRILFIVCPFSSTEGFLRRAYGDGHYFLTVPGAIPDLDDPFTLETVRNLIVDRGVRCIQVVNDASCRFIDAVVGGRDAVGLPVGERLAETYAASGLERAVGLSRQERRMRLAECNVRRQLERMEDAPVLGETMKFYGVRAKATVTCRENGLIMDLNRHVRNRVVHEH